jgi:hypothetical protein
MSKTVLLAALADRRRTWLETFSTYRGWFSIVWDGISIAARGRFRAAWCWACFWRLFLRVSQETRERALRQMIEELNNEHRA